MNAMKKLFFTGSGRILSAAFCLVALGACGALNPTATAHPAYYALDNVQSAAAVTMPAAAPTLIINPPHATAGFASPRIIYVREAHKLEYFAQSEWIDPPARMLAPLLVTATANTGAFRAVVLTPSAAAGDLRLDTEIIRLQHEFGTLPSRVRFTLRANLVDNKTREVLAWREFDTSVAAASEDAYGGVIAANRAVATVLENVSAFCAETARNAWKKK
jgi:cholesterol transport system auxiliary component